MNQKLAAELIFSYPDETKVYRLDDDSEVTINTFNNVEQIRLPSGEILDFIYGLMDAHVFYSMGTDENNNSLYYTFLSDKNKRSMVASIGKNKAFTSVGVPDEWILANSLLTPLYEYHQMTNDYLDPNDYRGVYYSMWSNYLSQVPMIREFSRRYFGVEFSG